MQRPVVTPEKSIDTIYSSLNTKNGIQSPFMVEKEKHINSIDWHDMFDRRYNHS